MIILVWGGRDQWTFVGITTNGLASETAGFNTLGFGLRPRPIARIAVSCLASPNGDFSVKPSTTEREDISLSITEAISYVAGLINSGASHPEPDAHNHWLRSYGHGPIVLACNRQTRGAWKYLHRRHL